MLRWCDVSAPLTKMEAKKVGFGTLSTRTLLKFENFFLLKGWGGLEHDTRTWAKLGKNHGGT